MKILKTEHTVSDTISIPVLWLQRPEANYNSRDIKTNLKPISYSQLIWLITLEFHYSCGFFSVTWYEFVISSVLTMSVEDFLINLRTDLKAQQTCEWTHWSWYMEPAKSMSWAQDFLILTYRCGHPIYHSAIYISSQNRSLSPGFLQHLTHYGCNGSKNSTLQPFCICVSV